MDQKTLFVADHLRALFSMTELCERFGISRKTGYKWLARFQTEGPAGLVDRYRRPKSCPHQTPQSVVDAVLEARRRHPSWGAKKLLTILRGRHPDWPWPARSTVCDILKREGRIAPGRRRRRPGHPGKPQTPMTAPNQIWTADFKGQFRSGDGQYCYPLTVADGFSRYILGCQGLLSPSLKGTQTVFKRLFREFGLPRIIRTDNGAPFATCAIRRLSRLSIWWIRLGIYPELIEPLHPEQNGRHERMHRTLKAETARRRPTAGHSSDDLTVSWRSSTTYALMRPWGNRPRLLSTAPQRDACPRDYHRLNTRCTMRSDASAATVGSAGTAAGSTSAKPSRNNISA
jgi:transposase